MGLNWALLLFVGVLLSCGSCVDWMGAGNFTQGNLTILMAKINAFDRTSFTSTHTASATTLSTELNDLWAPAWNVVIIYFEENIKSDAVLYGYGFNGHWFWFNGIQASDGNYLSFIIWKDFNCVRWITIDQGASSFTQETFGNTNGAAITNYIKSGFAGRDLTDIWAVAQNIQAKVPASSLTVLQDKLAYSVIAAQSSNAYFFANICAKDYAVVNGIANKGGVAKGAALIMQMRQS